MSEQNLQAVNSSSLPILPAKRRRGRPRKDGSVAEKVISSSSQSSETRKIIQPGEVKEQGTEVDDMVGRMVSGVIDGCFDAGYFLTVRVANSSALLRGVVFQPGRFSPITAATDVVPQAKMFERRDMPVPVLNNGVIPQSDMPAASEQVLHHPKPSFSPSMVVSQPQSGSGSGSVSVSVPAMSRSNSVGLLAGEKAMGPGLNLYQNHQPQSAAPPPPLENLRMVEQDEVMQVFEISTQPQWLSSSKVNAADVSCSEETGSQVSQTYSQRSTEPSCFKAYDWDLSNSRLSQNPAENQAVESKMEENKSPNLDQHPAVSAQPHYVPQFQAPSESISQEPHSESKNTGLEFIQALPPVLINSRARAVDFTMENPSAPQNDASNESLKGKPFGYPAENGGGESQPAGVVGTSEENVTHEQPAGRLETQIYSSESCTLPDFRFGLDAIVSPTANPTNTP
nr:uncharacterized protein LOC109165175 [Ipomoea batatas]